MGETNPTMAGEQVAPTDPDADQPPIDRPHTDLTQRVGEDILLRNFDTESAHQVMVTIGEEHDDRTAPSRFEATYTIDPDETFCEMDVLPSGIYEVTVKMDDRKEATETVTIDSHPLNRILIEIGNGIVSVADGGY